jgi:hypothetical protein
MVTPSPKLTARQKDAADAKVAKAQAEAAKAEAAKAAAEAKRRSKNTNATHTNSKDNDTIMHDQRPNKRSAESERPEETPNDNAINPDAMDATDNNGTNVTVDNTSKKEKDNAMDIENTSTNDMDNNTTNGSENNVSPDNVNVTNDDNTTMDNNVSTEPTMFAEDPEEDNIFKEMENDPKTPTRRAPVLPSRVDPYKDFTPTLPNDKRYNVLLQLNEEMVALAKKPYLGVSMEDDEDADGCHNDIRFLLQRMAKIWDINFNIANAGGLDMACWTQAFCAIATNNPNDFPYIEEMPTEDIIKFKVIMSRLSRTPPQVMFGFKIDKGNTPTTNISKAWFAATTSLGSRYIKNAVNFRQTTLAFVSPNNASPNSSSLAAAVTNNATQTNTVSLAAGVTGTNPIKDAIDTLTTIGTTGAAQVSPASQDNQGNRNTATVSPAAATAHAAQVSPSPTNTNNSADPSNNGSTIRPNQLQYTIQSVNSIRIVMKVKIPSLKEGKTPNTWFLNHVKEFMTAAKQEDSSVQLLPWKSEDKAAPGDIISTVAQIPSKLVDFKKYTQSVTPKNNSVCWWKSRWACSDDPANIFLSKADSATKYWFDEHNAGSYRCPVQNSYNVIELGDALYSGNFCNPEYVEASIQLVAETVYGKKLRFGIRIKKTQEIQADESSKSPGSWLMQPNQLLHVEVDKADANQLKNILYACFNKQEDRMKRPGFYPFNFLPDKSQMKTCYASGTQMRKEAYKKHQAIVSNLILIKTTDIKELNTTCTVNGESWSCRKFMMGLRSPITETTGNKYLFHTVDYAASGQDADACVVYVTAFKDREDLANSAMDILPALVNRQLGMACVKAWFEPTILDDIHDTEFLYDDAGNWLGTWHSPDDNANKQIMEEDLGFTVVLEGLDLI